jgi:8-oxo-dGTP diphosphatase
MREFFEETGLKLVNPKLQGISYWKDSAEGIIFIYTADEFEGELITNSSEGNLEWIKLDELLSIKQFEQNEKFTPFLFKNKLFEGKFLLDNDCRVVKYEIKEM